ncbi:MAG TPA: hypothetical protein EYH28_04600 [Anaerolineaceae bacterium]|nr:hypothetical protein [Anaerolineales bacterium]HIQ08783.1 hypothetical protein [Anaerolineaceae bacterium]
MKSNPLKAHLKAWLGRVPGLAEADWYLRGRRTPPVHRYLRLAAPYLAHWGAWAEVAASARRPGRKVALFAGLPWWVMHLAVMGLGLAAQGQRVTLGYLPHRDWWQPASWWVWRKWDVQMRAVLRPAARLLRPVSLLRVSPASLPAAWEGFLRRLSAYDVEYTRQREGVAEEDPLYPLRLARNRFAARVLRRWLMRERPEVLIVPNGAILEFGVAYEMGQRLGIPVVTYEFEYQRERVWLSQKRPVMDLDTDDLWAAVRSRPLSSTQVRQLEEMMTARRGGRTWGVHARAWQNVAQAGANEARRTLGLDDRPVVLLATNVFGDSVTIGRQVFSQGMSDWLSETLRFFASRPQVQLVVRVHPGESLLAPGGTSMLEVVRRALPDLPAHIKVVPPEARVNSYDIAALAQAGLVYTTTLGMEMAMDGLPVIVAGQVHYRGRGFTYDPTSWEEYFTLLQKMVGAPEDLRPKPEQVELARRYAYHFFFTYPRPYPWHILFFGEDLDHWPLDRALSHPEFAETLENFAGAPMDWERWSTFEDEMLPPGVQTQSGDGMGQWQRQLSLEESEE